MVTGGETSLPDRDAIESAQGVYSSIRRTFPEAVTNFESKWTPWQERCKERATWASLDICAQGDEFEALKRLGPKIIPFIVWKLAGDADQHPYGVFLYNALEKDAAYRANPDEALVSEEVLRCHSSQIVQLNYQRNQILTERLGLWAAHCWRHRIHASVDMCCECDEYDDLVELGPSVIAQLMVEWTNDRGGYWYELLHEIVHGRKMGAHMVKRQELFAESVQFFNEGDHDQAPIYIPTEWDEYIYTGKMGPKVWEHFRGGM